MFAKIHNIFVAKKVVFFELMPHERVLAVQKKHWLTIFLLFISHFLIVFLLSGAIALLLYFQFPPIFPTIMFYSMIVLVSFLALSGTHLCMDWYYTFYIVTNRRLVVRHFFKTEGAYYKEVFLQPGSRYEIRRITPNLLYELLDVEDVYVDFRQLESPEPFIFEAPQKPGEIERALYEIETKR